ncbi:ectoine synthase [Gimesia maris]|jgi:L-ectoine synthase|uniref:L-ectoine synthase n=1 Tax=Gimesia maris TaxID=122 RepID=A0ABX5YSG8_9PLAN|nr:ectoine synthase [Gimesia maris]HAW29152.1 ectoine synthase [Planctomycetaceae bacterium]EDL60148.1 ectoine synthase [Gimesia maris DSM 8797]QDT80970.1 L-ectoine synthase [Gimesia maris]QDU16690.1 L-ectoine synthase [Gimesia maris]QEG18734.1 L-ectoine synthase [Gimesia maris]|tara:strand:- start:3755 stop:4150 length:396 start_codon:yes stop_codon:yes gene_type:complete
MIVTQLEDILGTDRDVHAETWNSRRLLLAGQKMGFSLHDTLIHPGTETEIWYQNHLEAVYCIEGEGEIELIPGGPTYAIKPGMMYALNEHDRHLLRAKTQLRMICVFNPPVTGQEVHDENGVYPAAAGTDA